MFTSCLPRVYHVFTSCLPRVYHVFTSSKDHSVGTVMFYFSELFYVHICVAYTTILVSWYFEPSQPQRVTSRLKTMFSPSPIYSAR